MTRCYITFLHLLRPTFWTSSPLFLQNPSSNKSHCFWIGLKWLIWMCFGEKQKDGGHRTSNFLSVASTFCQSLCFRGALTTVMFRDSHEELSEKRKDNTCEQASEITLTKNYCQSLILCRGRRDILLFFFLQCTEATLNPPVKYFYSIFHCDCQILWSAKQ